MSRILYLNLNTQYLSLYAQRKQSFMILRKTNLGMIRSFDRGQIWGELIDNANANELIMHSFFSVIQVND